MASKWATLGGAAFALLLISSLPISAVARGGGGGGGGHFGGGHFGGGHFGGGHLGGGHMGGFSFGGARMGAPPRFAHGGARFANRPFFHERRFHHRHANFFFVPAYGYYDYGYGYSCYWLRRNALATGSPYWWNRYYACVYGYGY